MHPTCEHLTCIRAHVMNSLLMHQTVSECVQQASSHFLALMLPCQELLALGLVQCQGMLLEPVVAERASTDKAIMNVGCHCDNPWILVDHT